MHLLVVRSFPILTEIVPCAAMPCPNSDRRRPEIVPCAAMPCRPPDAAPKPRGRRPRPFDTLGPRQKRRRRSLDAKTSTALVVVETPVKPAKEPQKRGPKLIPYAKLTKEGRRKRIYRAGLEERRSRQQLLALLDVAAEAASVEAEEAQQQQLLLLQRQARQKKLVKLLEEKNQDGERGLVLRQTVQRGD